MLIKPEKKAEDQCVGCGHLREDHVQDDNGLRCPDEPHPSIEGTVIGYNPALGMVRIPDPRVLK